MARERLTDKRVATMKPPADGRHETFDTVKTGLCYRVTATGARSWSVLYRFNGELRRDTLGPYPKIGLAKARQMAGDALELVGQGKDPRALKAAAVAAQEQQQADTVEVVGNLFIARYASKRRWRDLTGIINRDIIPRWRERPISSITRKEVIAFIDDIVDRGAEVQANRVVTVAKRFFGWAIDKDIIENDPTARVKKPTKESPRERVLSDAELRAFWRGCDRLGWPFGPLLQLLAMTAQRKSEIAHLTRAEINHVEKVIEITGAKYKTGKPHTVPLSSAALAIMADLPQVGTKSDLLFTTNGATPVSAFSKAKVRLDAYMLAELRLASTEPGKVVLIPWTIHDLRRTARSNFSKLGFRPRLASSGVRRWPRLF
jgi:integrase